YSRTLPARSAAWAGVNEANGMARSTGSKGGGTQISKTASSVGDSRQRRAARSCVPRPNGTSASCSGQVLDERPIDARPPQGKQPHRAGDHDGEVDEP